MSYAIICSSKTGNTEKLARRAREVLGEEGAGPVADAELVLLGSWTDKGGLDPALDERLGGACRQEGLPLRHLRVWRQPGILRPRARPLCRRASEGARIVGRFMCQGQMPPAVRERYVAMAERDPGKFGPMIENFDRALGHPDAADLEAFEAALRAAGLA